MSAPRQPNPPVPDRVQGKVNEARELAAHLRRLEEVVLGPEMSTNTFRNTLPADAVVALCQAIEALTEEVRGARR